MRNNEQFKELVYKKASVETARIKKRNAAILRGASAFCLCIALGGAVFYSGLFKADEVKDANNSVNFVDGAVAEYQYMYSISAPKTAAYIQTEIAVADNGTIPESVFEDETQLFSYGSDDLDVITADERDNGKGNESGSTYKITADEAVEIATLKCTVEHDTVDVFYDDEACVWKIVFYTANTAGGCQSVYLEANGDLRLIVHGE